MSLRRAIEEALKGCIESESKKKPKKREQKKKVKRKTNWKAIKEMIKKYDYLSKKEKIEADKTWGRPIPYWKLALKYHKEGLKDSEAKKRAKEDFERKRR